MALVLRSENAVRQSMPRRPRHYTPNLVYHVLNRGARRAALFDNSEEYAAFEHVLVEATQRVPIRLLAYCAMQTHWHLVLWPETVTQMPRFMHWMTTTHAQRWHARRKTAGTGPVYQGRYKAVGVHSERRVLRVCRYVEAQCSERRTGVPRRRMAMVQPVAAVQFLRRWTSWRLAGSNTR